MDGPVLPDFNSGWGQVAFWLVTYLIELVISRVAAERASEEWRRRLYRSEVLIGFIIGAIASFRLRELVADQVAGALILLLLPLLYALIGAAVGVIVDHLSERRSRARLQRERDEEEHALFLDRKQRERAALYKEFPILTSEHKERDGDLPEEIDLRETSGIDVRISQATPIGLQIQSFEPTANYSAQVRLLELSGDFIRVKNETADIYSASMIGGRRARRSVTLHAKDRASIRLATTIGYSGDLVRGGIVLQALGSMHIQDEEHPIAEVWCDGDKIPGRAVLRVRIYREAQAPETIFQQIECVKDLKVAIEMAYVQAPEITILEGA